MKTKLPYFLCFVEENTRETTKSKMFVFRYLLFSFYSSLLCMCVCVCINYFFLFHFFLLIFFLVLFEITKK